MKKVLMPIISCIVLVYSSINFAKSPSVLFNVSASGNTLSINTNITNHTYPNAGIKINTPNYSLANPGTDCLLNSNGYCLFPVSDSKSKDITIAGNSGQINITLCLNGAGPLSCQNYNNIPITSTPLVARYLYVTSPYGDPTKSIFVCSLNPTNGSIISCADAGGHPDLDGSNPQGIKLNSTNTIAYITNGNGTSIVYQCNINSVDGTFSSCTAITVTTPAGYAAGYGMIALNPDNSIAYLVDNGSSPRVISCNIINGILNGACLDGGAHNISNSGEGITLNRAGTTSYIADYSEGLFVCSVNGTSVQNICTLITNVGPVTISGASDVAFNGDQSLLYIADYSGNAIDACNSNFSNCFQALPFPNVGGIVINATSTMAYVTNFGSSVYACPILSDGTLSTCTTTSPPNLSGAIGLALSY